MKLQGRNLTTGLKGQDVALLQSELAALHFSIASTEISDTSFGTATRQAVIDFQKAQGLPTTGIVDEATATRINATLAEAQGAAQQFVVQGHVHLKDGHAFDGVIVRAFDKDLRSEEPLGQAITMDGGGYHITYGPDLFRHADKNSADLIVRVFGQKGLLLATSDILFNAPAIATIDLTVSPLTTPLSEYEQHLADLTPALENVSLAELTDEDVAFLTGETGIDKQHIDILRQAAQLSRLLGISAATLYGLGRENIALSITNLAATSLDTLRKTVETAISQLIIPASLHDSLAGIMQRLKQLQLQQALKTKEQFTAHDFTGQLLNQNTSAILAGFSLHAFDLDAGTAPQDLGRYRTNAQGLFAFTYTTNKVWEASHTERKLRLSILDQQAQEIAKVDIQVSLGQDTMMAVRVSIPTAPEPVAPTTTLALLSTEPQVTQTLIQRGYTSLAAIARAPRSDFVSFAQGTLGDAGAAQLREIASAQTYFLDNALTSLRLYSLNGLLGKQPDGASSLGKFLTPLCDCQDCEAATSPGAYLADLLQYTLTHVNNKQDALTLQFLEETFHQAFHDLPSSCDAVVTLVRQVRLCVEVLRSSLDVTQATLSPAQQGTLTQATKDYLIAAYTALLEQFGTSYEEIRLAHRASGTQRAALADRLGIDLGPTRLDHLDALFLDPSAAATSPSGLTEQALERLFGLVDTTRNPLAVGNQPDLLTWRLAHLRVLWKQEDWSIDPASTKNPLIDPDLIGPGDLKQPTVDDPAFQLWQERRNWIDEQMTSLKNEVLHATFPTPPTSPVPVLPPPLHPPAIPGVTDSSSSPALTALDAIIASSLGISVQDLATLATQRAQGHNIEARLRQLNLSNEAFSYLWDIHTLLANNAPLLDSEWDDVYAILVQAKKLQVFAQWRQQEQERGIFLGPDFFTIPPQPTTFPPPKPVPLPSWRASADALRDWQQTLQSRIDQEQATGDALYTAVDAVEEAALPKLRNALIMFVQAGGTTLQTRAQWITDHLFIDAFANGCLQTTRIAQAIETIQNLLTALRINRLYDTYPNLALYADHFDEEWQWLGSYATWRTALLVFLYPENLLQPDLRTWQTPAFRDLTTNLRGNLRLTPQSACDAAATYFDYFYDVCHLGIGACCQARTRMYTGDSCRTRTATDYRDLFYLFALANTSSQKVYWSAYDSSDASGYAQTFWEEVPELSGVLNIIGAVPYQLAPDQRAIYLFVRLQRGGQRLVFIKYDLEKQAWGQSTELELPNKATAFTAVVKQTTTEDQPPRLAIRTVDGAIYDRKLNTDGTDWEDASADNKKQNQATDTKQQSDKTSEDAWKSLIDAARGGDFAVLFAMVEVAPDEYYLLVSRLDTIWYRLFGSHDDGHWRPFDNGTFSGAFSWPGTSDLFVFTTYPTTTYRVLKRSDVPLGQMSPDVITDSSALDLWLADVAGVMVYNILPVYNIENHDPGQNLDENSPQGKLWKEANALVQQFTVDHLPLGEVLYRVNHHQSVAFLSRDDSDVFVPPPDQVILSTSPDVITGIKSGESAPSGLDYIVARSGTADTSVQIAFIRNSGQVGSYRCNFTRAVDTLQEDTPIRLAPQVTGPFSLAEQLSSQKLQAVRFLVRQAFELNNDGSASNRTYLEEAYYFVPVLLALQLQSLGHYPAALDWFRHVYDYNTSIDARKIYYGLEQEQDASVVYQRADNWLLDPLNPHSIATTRPGAYTRFTLLSLSRCFLEFADAEFSRDTSESVARARTLYTTALDLLNSDELQQQGNLCTDVIGSLDVQVGQGEWTSVFERLKAGLRTISDPTMLKTIVAHVQQVLATDEPITSRFVKAQALISSTKASIPAPSTLGGIIEERTQLQEQLHTALLAQPHILEATKQVGITAGTDYVHALSLVSGNNSVALLKDRVALPWLRQQAAPMTSSNDGTASTAISSPAIRAGEQALLARFSPLAPTRTATLVKLAEANALQATNIARKLGRQYIPAPSYHFCIPPNPELESQRSRADLNLYKLRTCRNIAGLERPLDPYSAPTDTTSGLPSIGNGGQLVVPGAVTLRPTLYRYSALIERAKQLAQLAGQIESAMLTALEKRDAEAYTLLKARNDVQLAQAGVRLQTLRVKEAQGGVKLAELQRDRAKLQVDHYKALLAADISDLEGKQLELLGLVSGLYLTAAELAAIPNLIVGLASGSIIDFAGTVSNVAQSIGTQASITALQASYERRRQDWQYQQTLAQQDSVIGDQQVTNAEDHVRVVGQEAAIAQMQADNAEAVVEFLANKFTNVELYSWMSDVLGRVYGFFLQQATAIAQLAANQLAFERQEVPPPFIQSDYWQAPTDNAASSSDGNAPDRRGLTGSARLLQDIYQLDQYAFSTNQRKLQLTKTISLFRLDPFAFQQLRETGVMVFETAMEQFDRDFPGHYLRLIKRVRVSVIALIPPTQGIRATLTSRGVSRTVIGGDVFQTATVKHDPEIVALSSPRDATGLFELDTQSDLLLPFEGTGIDTTWEFSMPKAANMFDYSTIADVLISFEYTALNSFTYRQQVLQTLKPTLSADRAFSFRQEFADQWYDLHNPDQTATPMTVRFATGREDFPPNLDALVIQQVVLYFARSTGVQMEVSVGHLLFRAAGSNSSLGGAAVSLDGVISTRKGNAASWASMIGSNLVGDWELALSNDAQTRALFENEQLSDILLVITYSGRTPTWPG